MQHFIQKMASGQAVDFPRIFRGRFRHFFRWNSHKRGNQFAGGR